MCGYLISQPRVTPAWVEVVSCERQYLLHARSVFLLAIVEGFVPVVLVTLLSFKTSRSVNGKSRKDLSGIDDQHNGFTGSA